MKHHEEYSEGERAPVGREEALERLLQRRHDREGQNLCRLCAVTTHTHSLSVLKGPVGTRQHLRGEVDKVVGAVFERVLHLVHKRRLCNTAHAAAQ